MDTRDALHTWRSLNNNRTVACETATSIMARTLDRLDELSVNGMVKEGAYVEIAALLKEATIWTKAATTPFVEIDEDTDVEAQGAHQAVGLVVNTLKGPFVIKPKDADGSTNHARWRLDVEDHDESGRSMWFQERQEKGQEWTMTWHIKGNQDAASISPQFFIYGENNARREMHSYDNEISRVTYFVGEYGKERTSYEHDMNDDYVPVRKRYIAGPIEDERLIKIEEFETGNVTTFEGEHGNEAMRVVKSADSTMYFGGPRGSELCYRSEKSNGETHHYDTSNGMSRLTMTTNYEAQCGTAYYDHKERLARMGFKTTANHPYTVVYKPDEGKTMHCTASMVEWKDYIFYLNKNELLVHVSKNEAGRILSVPMHTMHELKSVRWYVDEDVHGLVQRAFAVPAESDEEETLVASMKSRKRTKQS